VKLLSLDETVLYSVKNPKGFFFLAVRNQGSQLYKTTDILKINIPCFLHHNIFVMEIFSQNHLAY